MLSASTVRIAAPSLAASARAKPSPAVTIVALPSWLPWLTDRLNQ